MNSLQDVVETIQDILERPDFTMESPMVRSSVRRAINQVHTLSWFSRDLQVISEPVGSADSSHAFTLPDSYRKLKEINLLDIDGNLLTNCFEQGRLHRRPSQNYSLSVSNYYVTLGDELRVYWGNANLQGTLELVFYSFPDVFYDDEEGQWMTTSWLIPTYEQVVVYNAAKALAGNTESSAFTQLSNVAQEAEFALLNDAAVQVTDSEMRS